jgi:hypothetical protein
MHQDAHFDYSSLFTDAQVEKVGNPEKNVKTDRIVLIHANASVLKVISERSLFLVYKCRTLSKE